MKISKISFAFCFLAVSFCQAQNFDCAKASNLTEESICNSAELREFDSILSRTYELVLATAINPGALKAEQKRWINQRNACKDSDECLEKAYEARIEALEKSRAKRELALDRNPKMPQDSKPFEGHWSSCGLWKGYEICSGYRLVQNGKQICGEWEYWATNRTYSGQLQATARSSNQADIKLICGTAGSATSTECQDDPEQKSGWESGKGGLSRCRNQLFENPDKPCNDETYLQGDYRYRPLTPKESLGLRSEVWVKSCLAGDLPKR